QEVGLPDSDWEVVSLPHTWNAADGQDGGNDYYRGVGWYRKQLLLDEQYRGKSIFLFFEAAATVAHVFVNGRLAGTHKGGFSAFCFDISPLARFGENNVIAVKVSNAHDTTIAPLRGDFTIFGGLYRNVRLLVLDQLSISPLDYASSGVYVTQSNVSQESATLEITAVVRNGSPGRRDATLRCTIADAEGNIVTTATSTVSVASGSKQLGINHVVLSNIRLWNGRNDPYLYDVTVEVVSGNFVVDRVDQQVGLRFFRADPDKGFFLNGGPYRLHGANRHQDRENMGWAISFREHEEDYRLLREMGCSAVRLAHYQHAQEFYSLCDQGGMVVWAELALVDFVNPSEEFMANCRQQLTELIKQNYNHPSIMFWCLFNELIPEADPALYGRVVDELNTLSHRLDPGRLTTSASRSMYDGDLYINTVTDLIGYNVYKGWYEDMPADFAAYADNLKIRFPRHRISIAEYGAGAGISQHEVPPRKPKTTARWHPEEWQSTFHEVIWNAMGERPFLWGTFVWNMFDFASDGRAEGELPGRNDKGLVTFDRRVKKDAFFWYKANWNPEPMVYITSRRFTQRPAGATEIRVYSNCDSVSVSVNGKSLGTQTSNDHLFLWNDVVLAVGPNVIQATGLSDGRRINDSCTWEATGIR
ncbi:MAG: glycoside hydrolase family 2 protein, partial [Ignavibacteria bacterium]|nr:glycoside hydrolase family 2 protein [Ignavibacteria bacterium]